MTSSRPLGVILCKYVNPPVPDKKRSVFSLRSRWMLAVSFPDRDDEYPHTCDMAGSLGSAKQVVAGSAEWPNLSRGRTMHLK